MKLEILDSNGNIISSSNVEDCLYDATDFYNMYNNGFRFRVDGFLVNLGAVKPDPFSIANSPSKNESSTNTDDSTCDGKNTNNNESTINEDAVLEDVNTKRSNSTQVRCIETGQVWESQAKLAKILDIKPSKLNYLIKNKKSFNGYTFEKL